MSGHNSSLIRFASVSEMVGCVVSGIIRRLSNSGHDLFPGVANSVLRITPASPSGALRLQLELQSRCKRDSPATYKDSSRKTESVSAGIAARETNAASRSLLFSTQSKKGPP